VIVSFLFALWEARLLEACSWYISGQNFFGESVQSAQPFETSQLGLQRDESQHELILKILFCGRLLSRGDTAAPLGFLATSELVYGADTG
jgi:hypothetical protein